MDLRILGGGRYPGRKLERGGLSSQDIRTKGAAWVSPGQGKSQREGVKLRRERSGEELRRVKRKIKRFGQKAVHLRKNHVLDTLSVSPN